MRVDVKTLGTFNELANRGASSAASSLAQLSDTETSVEVTSADLVPAGDIADRFDDDATFVGVEIGFEGGMEGSIVLVFDRESAGRLLERIVPEHWDDVDATLDRSTVSEVANIMTGGFVDAWANHFDTRLQLGPPTYISGAAGDVIPGSVPTWDDRRTALTFTSQLQAPRDASGDDPASPDAGIDFHIYMFPERSSFAAVVGEAVPEQEFPISIEKLSAFTEMTKRGAGRAADKLSGMTGIQIDVEVGRTTFVPIPEVSRHAPSAQRIGSVAELQAAPGGFIVILFDEHSAINVGDALLPIETSEPGLTDQHRSAIEEIGNIMTSGFIDGWANTLDRKIQHNPPEIVEDTASATLGSLVDRLGPSQEYAFLLDATVRAAGREINCDLYAIPEEHSFRQVLGEMSMPEARTAASDPDALEPAAYDDLK
ncbi:CheA histidine kinase [Salinarchaeum sp. Harcht-Bsk1]|uniref:chemotaxis protein CheC n=1 Tax=Salinarchaeum sp. Harcht-Bsk1 TaxID=1333523 RepID=UPI00034249A4|nr:chemotaxis protein CheC [Salinarchaeum sp. Harcht-Bsk1]AGN00417.1 CheA histidine kinase [Salinarchaeum sp. Harcht-Bsk1]